MIEEVIRHMVEAFGRMPWSGILAVGAIAVIIRILDGDISLPKLDLRRRRYRDEEDEDEDYEYVLVRRRRR